MKIYTRAALTVAAAALLWSGSASLRAQDANRDTVLMAANAQDLVDRLDELAGRQ